MEKRENRRILAEEAIAYGGMLLRYRLIDRMEENGRFHVVAANGAECEEVSVGNDICFAADCYRAVRDGRVTPCTLDDVIRDLHTMAINFSKPLYK